MTYKVQKPCKVCGKMYTPCVDCERDQSIFHWRTVACSVECGLEFFRQVEEARKPKETEHKEESVPVSEETKTIKKKKSTVKNNEESE